MADEKERKPIDEEEIRRRVNELTPSGPVPDGTHQLLEQLVRVLPGVIRDIVKEELAKEGKG